MKTNFFNGRLVNLVPLDMEKDLVLWEKWDRDSEYKRLLDDIPAAQFSSSLIKEYIENNTNDGSLFMVHTVSDDRVIGFIELGGYDWADRNAWVGIGIGDPEYRGKGYGTESMQLLLGYAFKGLNLHRVNLNVFAYNKRAIRSYEKCGFRYEGTQRESIYKEDQRWDVIDMGILRSDWEQFNQI